MIWSLRVGTDEESWGAKDHMAEAVESWKLFWLEDITYVTAHTNAVFGKE